MSSDSDEEAEEDLGPWARRLLQESFPDLDLSAIDAAQLPDDAEAQEVETAAERLLELVADQAVVPIAPDALFTLPWSTIFGSGAPHHSRHHPIHGNGGPLSDCEVALIPLPNIKRIVRISQSIFHEGQMVWGAARALTYIIERGDFLVKGKSVIDLGAGTGLVGFACSLLGASSVTLTDLPEVLPHMSANAALNGLEAQVCIQEYIWGRESEYPLAPPYDVVLVSDCLYVGYVVPLLMRAMLFVSGESTQILLSHRRRDTNEEHAFSILATVFEITVCSQALLPKHLRDADIHVCRLVRKCPPSSAQDEELLANASQHYHQAQVGRRSSGWLTPGLNA